MAWDHRWLYDVASSKGDATASHESLFGNPDCTDSTTKILPFTMQGKIATIHCNTGGFPLAVSQGPRQIVRITILRSNQVLKAKVRQQRRLLRWSTRMHLGDSLCQDFQFVINTFSACLCVEMHAIIFSKALQRWRDDTNPTLSRIIARLVEDGIINSVLRILWKVSWVAANPRNMV